MRKSSYATYPGTLQVLSKYVAAVYTQRFLYSNQASTTELSVFQYTGQARLFMAWAADVQQTEKEYLGGYDPTGALQPLPRGSYTFFNNPPALPTQIPQDYYQCRVNSSNFIVEYKALSGPPALILQDYIHMTIFNDSFDAEFVEAEEV